VPYAAKSKNRRRDDRDWLMFFLLRVAFWLTIVLALLPTGSAQPTARGPQMGEAISAAGDAVSDVRHFCTRQPAACEVGSQVAVMIGQRAQAGAKMLYDLFNEHTGPTETGSIPGAQTEPAVVTTPSATTPSDRVPNGRSSERR
jgi:uncharacterized protein DUF5330